MVNKGKTALEASLSATGVVGRGGLCGLAGEISLCRICRDQPVGPALAHEPRPVARLSETARVLIAGQAPGTRVHASGLPFTDPSGERLRDWMGIGPEVFYDPAEIAILPMGLCFPGLDAKGGDLPPRKECRKTWHDRILAGMPQVRLVLAIGQYAQAYHLGPLRRSGLTQTVAAWREILAETSARGGPEILPLPHPSWRNNAWLKRHPWFESDLLADLRQRIAQQLGR